MKNLKKFALVMFVVLLTIMQLTYTPTLAADTVQQTVKKETEYMPPNPDVYSVEKGNAVPNNKIQLSSLNNNTNKKNVAPLRISSSNVGDVEKILVIPIQFIGTSFSSTYNQQYFQNIVSGPENSMKEYYERNSGYYKDNSKGITIASTISEVVTSTKTMSYYGKDSTSGIDDANIDVAEMAREAVKILDSKGFDFSSFDSDNDKVIDHIIIIHAGNGQEAIPDSDNTLIWSHRGEIGNVIHNNYTDGQLVDGVYAYNYTTVSETSTLGAYCHEFGHDLGLPDLYDTDGDYNGNTEGVGDWDVMGSGSWNTIPGEPAGSCPSNLSAWSKLYMGWVNPVEIISNPSEAISISNTDGNSTVYQLWPNGDTNSNEYFLAEYRRRAEYDAGIPGEGVLVWHVDKQKITAEVMEKNEVNADDQKLGVELEQADGSWNLWLLNNSGDAGDPFPGSSENYNFIGASYGIKMYDGEKFKYNDKTYTYFGNTLYGANYSNIETNKSTNVELRNISVDGTNATMDCSVIAANPTKPILMAPYDAAIVDTKALFTWSVTEDTKTFVLQMSESYDFNSGIKELKIDRTNGLFYTGDKLAYILSDALDNGKTYNWRVAGINDIGTGEWSDVRSFSTTKMEDIPNGIIAPSIPTNFQSITSPTAIAISWDAVPNATGYYILVDGVESYCTTNMFEHTGLTINSLHEYIVKAANADYSSNWSEATYLKTSGAPELSANALSIIEGAENGGNVVVSLSNGVFRPEGIYNRATVSLNPNDIPTGTKQGEVTRIDDTHLNIQLSGNSTVDYDTNITINVTIAKELITTGKYEDTTGAAIIVAVVEPTPGVPNISFSFTGTNAGKLVGTTPDMEYSLDGGNTYSVITVADMVLTTSQINSISATNDIRVRFKASLRRIVGAVQIIDILASQVPPPVTPPVTDATPAPSGGAVGGGTAVVDVLPAVPVILPVTGSTAVVKDNKITITAQIDNGIASSKLEDANLSKALEKAVANKDGVKTIIVEVNEIKDVKEYGFEVATSKVSSKTKDLIIEVVTSFGTIALPNNILKQEEVKNVENIGISIANADLSKLDSALRKEIGNKPAIELIMKKDGKAFTWSNLEAPITISLVYRPTAEELKNPDHIVVWYIDGEGKAQAVPNAKYDVKTGKVVFTVTHFSKYVIAYNYVKFDDLTRFKWAENQIEVMASKGIISDIEGAKFNPGQNITRGMLLDYIIKALGLTASYNSNFSDVKASDSYYDSVGIAKKLGIIAGIGQNKFNPNTEITRQEMMTILDKALRVAKKISLKGSTADISQFKDTSKIAQYAIESTATMVKEGMIAGSGKMIDPTGKVTKAQGAVIAFKCYFK